MLRINIYYAQGFTAVMLCIRPCSDGTNSLKIILINIMLFTSFTLWRTYIQLGAVMNSSYCAKTLSCPLCIGTLMSIIQSVQCIYLPLLIITASPPLPISMYVAHEEFINAVSGVSHFLLQQVMPHIVYTAPCAGGCSSAYTRAWYGIGCATPGACGWSGTSDMSMIF